MVLCAITVSRSSVTVQVSCNLEKVVTYFTVKLPQKSVDQSARYFLLAHDLRFVDIYISSSVICSSFASY
eukprot:snap_masked-scaffold_77-processed-gene-0.41-mRNA-1 protein AED:1.00 eAED:1.00 QI:0/0/0/0/1/1/2/0/69